MIENNTNKVNRPYQEGFFQHPAGKQGVEGISRVLAKEDVRMKRPGFTRGAKAGIPPCDGRSVDGTLFRPRGPGC